MISIFTSTSINFRGVTDKKMNSLSDLSPNKSVLVHMSDYLPVDGVILSTKNASIDKNGLRKEIFKKITGRPKEGDIVECINPIVVLPIAMMSLFCMLWAIIFHNIFLGLFSMLLSWQIGWGMSIERFRNSEKKINNK